ncbi:unnamed protein product, partial [Polarella glacialis]
GSGSGLNVKLADSGPKGNGMAGGGRPSQPQPIPVFAKEPVHLAHAREEASHPLPEIFLGRLPPGLSVGEVEDVLVPYGAHNIRLLSGKNCAFATFVSWAAAERAIAELNGAQIGSAIHGEQAEGINVKLADLKGVPKGTPQNPKVFIGGIRAQVTESEVADECKHFGEVTFSKIFAKNSASLPCAFVTFATFTEAELCINELNGTEHRLALDGKTLNVRLADAAKGQAASQGARQPSSQAPPAQVPPQRSFPAPAAMGPPIMPYSMAAVAPAPAMAPGVSGGDDPKPRESGGGNVPK